MGERREEAAAAAPGRRSRCAGASAPPLELALAVGVALLRTVASVCAALLRLLWPRRLAPLRGSVVLVTGAGRGLGRALALRFAACGCEVVCVDVDAASNEGTARDINTRGVCGRARAFACDVSDAAQVRRLAAAVLADAGRVDVLVNNAGVMPVQPLLRAHPHHVVDVVNINLLSHFWMLLAFLPHMVARDSGHVVAISSMAGLAGLANKVPYSASKFAVAGLMDALGEELRLNKHNIKVTCVHPYFIHTRPDLPEELHLRIPELAPEAAAAEVVRAVREGLSCVTVPRRLLFWLHVLRALPQDARDVWRDLFYARVTPTDAAPAPAAPASPAAQPPAPPASTTHGAQPTAALKA